MLPHRFRHALNLAKLNKECLYGCDRLNVISYENYEKHKSKTVPQHQYRFMITPQKEFPLGSRLVHLEYGYCPIGYYQMWHSSLRRTYPIVCGSAEHSDVLFAVQWSREYRILLPEILVLHLESEKGYMGANWDGRVTKPFGPEGKVMEFVKHKGKHKVIHPFSEDKSY